MVRLVGARNFDVLLVISGKTGSHHNEDPRLVSVGVEESFV